MIEKLYKNVKNIKYRSHRAGVIRENDDDVTAGGRENQFYCEKKLKARRCLR